MNRTILALSCVLGITIVLALHITNPVNQQHRQQMNSLHYQEVLAIQPAKVIAVSVLYWIFIAIVMALAVVVLLAIYFRFIHPVAVHAHQAHKQRMKELETVGQFSQPSFEGVQTVNYNPRTHHHEHDSHDQTVSQHYKSPQQLAQHLPVGDIDATVKEFQASESIVTTPSFRQALNEATSTTLILGYDETGQAVHGTFESFFSFGVGGMPHSGKTSTVIWLLSQAVRQGAKLIIIDPHQGNPDSLANRLEPLAHAYLCRVASTPEDMLQNIRFAQSVFESRRSGTDSAKHYVIFVCDEWLACMRGNLKQEFQTLAEAISQEGRKYGVIGAFLSQKWDIAKSGDMRDTLTCHVFCRTRPNLARQQTGLLGRELPSDVMSLQKGQFYMLDTFGELRRLQAPYVSHNDLLMLASESFNSQHSNETTVGAVTEVVTKVKANDEMNRVNRGEVTADPNNFKPIQTVSPIQPLSSQEAQIISMFKNGKSIREIIFEIHNVKAGAKYNSYLHEVQELLRGQLTQFQ